MTQRGTRKNKKIMGGKTTASSTPVQLSFQSKPLVCSVCAENKYNEVIGTTGKSKIRRGLGDLVFGSAISIIDSTSVILYFCTNCGTCRTIRNVDPLQIVASPA